MKFKMKKLHKKSHNLKKAKPSRPTRATRVTRITRSNRKPKKIDIEKKCSNVSTKDLKTPVRKETEKVVRSTRSCRQKVKFEESKAKNTKLTIEVISPTPTRRSTRTRSARKKK